MGLFRRKKQTTIAELEEYYATQQTGKRTLKAWFMAFLSLLIAIAVIVGLFMAGRWLYRTLTANDATDVGQTQSESTNPEEISLPSFDGSLPARPSTPTDDSANNTATIPEPDGVVSDEAAVSTTPNTGATAGVATGNTLPNTGPGESVAIVLLMTVALGYLAARRKMITSK